MKRGKKLVLDKIFDLLNEGLNPAQISKKYNLPKTTISYSIGKLKKLGVIEKVGYGTWKIIKPLKEVRIWPKDTKKVKDGTSQKRIRGHAFIWNIVFNGEGYNWKQIVTNYKKKYKRPKLSFKLIRDQFPRTIYKKRKIWLTKAGMTIYEPLDFFGLSSFQVKGTAVYEVDKLIKDLLKELGQRIQDYDFICSREHFAHIKNQMARQFNDRGQRINVKFNGKNFWIDHSDGEHEEETDDPTISRQAQKYYTDHVKTGFSVTPSKILNQFEKQDKVLKKSLEVNEKYAEQIALHLEVEEEQLKTQKAIQKLLKKLSHTK